MSRLRSVRGVIARWLELYEAVPPSPLGGQLEALRLGLTGDDDSCYYRRAVGAEAAQVERAHLAYLFGVLLTESECLVVSLLNSPKTHRPRCSAVKGRGDCDCGALDKYERLARQADLQSFERVNADGSIDRHVVTPRGERFLRPARHDDFEPAQDPEADISGWVIVEGYTVTVPSPREVAEALGWPLWRVEAERRNGYQMIELSPQYIALTSEVQ